MSFVGESYLEPYLQAARKFGPEFRSLLWASPRSQRMRFDMIRQMCDLAGKTLLDAGCGRADLLAYLVERGIQPASYMGIEGVAALAAAARVETRRLIRGGIVIAADFVREPARLFVGADIIVFSGSLNTLADDSFYATLRRAYDAAGQAVVFNFLCSNYLAGREYLFWRAAQDVLRFGGSFCDDVRLRDDYLQGDCTACFFKPGAGPNDEAVHA